MRERINSEPFENSGYNDGHIALFDTGVWDSHVFLQDNDQLVGRHNCVPLICNELDPQDPQGDEQPEGHGTSTASILIGEDDPGSPDGGLLAATLNSYKVYTTTETGVVAVPEAVVCVIRKAIVEDPPYDLFVAEVAVPAGGEGAVTMAASRAYLWDILVIAANGNDGNEIPTPAVAPRVIGVGDYCVYSGFYEYQHVHGTTPDGRYKPDMTGPTATYTGGNGEAQAGNTVAGNTEEMHIYSGTSGATPYVAAVALMLKNWIAAATGTEVSPGLVYAVLLAMARSDQAATPEGAGRVMLPDEGAVLWGELSLETQDAWMIPLEGLVGYGGSLEAVVWWPIGSMFGWAVPLPPLRADIDLSVVDSDGNIVIESKSSASSFERIELSDLANHDGSSLEVYGYSVPYGPQTVYWAAWVHPPPLQVQADANDQTDQ